jgi:hypothetical protein
MCADIPAAADGHTSRVRPLPKASLRVVSATTGFRSSVGGGRPSLVVPGSGEVRAVSRDADGTERACCDRFEWTSSNTAVATVTGHGPFATVASVAPGTVTITARLASLTTSATFDVH